MRRSHFPSACVAFALAVLGAANGFGSFPQNDQAQAGTAGASAKIPEGLTIKVVSGQNGVNILKRRSAVAPVIQVLNQDNAPVGGAVVTFSAPEDGPGLKFSSGDRSTSAVTEMDGKASPAGLIPVEAGAFQITVSATYGDALRASATIDQTNYETAAEALRAGASVPAQAASTDNAGVATKSRRLSNGAIAGIIVAIAGAAAAGILLGLKHGGSSTSATIGVGTPTAGAPH